MSEEYPQTPEEEAALEKAREADLSQEELEEQQRMSRRAFIGTIFFAGASAGAAWLGYDGGLKVYHSEEEATKYHPNERNIDNTLPGVIGSLQGAISYLKYEPGHYETYTYTVPCGPDGEDTCLETDTDYVSPTYPNPRSARIGIDSAISSYKGISKHLSEEPELDLVSRLQGVRDRLPNVDIETVASDKYVRERSDIQTVLDEVRGMKNKYNEILYREVAPKRNTGIAELIGAPLLAIAALVLWVRDRSNQYIEERMQRRRRDKDY